MTENKSWWNKFIPAPEEGTVRFPLAQIIFGPYMLFIEKFKFFVYTGGIYALLMSLIYLLGGQSLFCSYRNFSLPEICADNLFQYIGTRLIMLAVISCYCVRYYKTVWMQQPFTLRAMFTPQKTDFYSLSAFVIIILLNAIAAVSWYLLSIREPNPDWRIELTYFGFVAIGFLVPFIVLRFYCTLAYIWQNEKIPPLWQIWKKTRGNGLRLLVAASLCFLLILFGLSAISARLNLLAENSSIYIVVGGEFIFNLTMLILVSCFVNFCGIQKLFLMEGNENEKTNLN